MAKRKRHQREPRKPLHEIHRGGIKRLKETIQALEKDVANLNFTLACILQQSGGYYEVHQKTRDFILKKGGVYFEGYEDPDRKVYVIKLNLETVGPKGTVVKKEEEDEVSEAKSEDQEKT